MSLFTNTLKKNFKKVNYKFTVQLKKQFSSGQKADGYKLSTTEQEHNDPKAYPFLISTKTGFLTRAESVTKLPEKFNIIESLLQRMPYYLPDGSPGLLQKGTFGATCDKELPHLDFDGIDDTMVLLALYREYSFICNAYLLEPCHLSWLKTGDDYGLGRDILPKNISVPYLKLAQKLGLKTYLEYNTGYGLNNFTRKDKSKTATLENIDAIRWFIGTESEKGFVKVHVTINEHGGNLIKSGVDVLKHAENNRREDFNNSLDEMKTTLMYMNYELDRMFVESSPNDYNTFRTFIMGIYNQPMFPKGVVYDGCYDNKPQFFRGETGANDSIIPFADNILEITGMLPENILTEALRDFRTYRPKSHSEFLQWTEDTAKDIGVQAFARKDNVSLLKLIEVADQVRQFRHCHWVLTNVYIMNKSTHPLATGGSPIVLWLPNQLLTVVKYIKANGALIDTNKLPEHIRNTHRIVMNRAHTDETNIVNQVKARRQQYKQ